MSTGPSRPSATQRPRPAAGRHRRRHRRLLVATGLFLLVAAVGSCAGEPRPTEPTELDLAAASATGSAETTSTAPAATEPAATEPAGTQPPSTTRASATTRPKPTATTPPTTRRRRATTTSPPAGDCHASYEGACLHLGIGDYDCAGGSGNGPNYVSGPITVTGADPFGLDRDGDGVACEA